MIQETRLASSLLLVALVSACGGGGSDGVVGSPSAESVAQSDQMVDARSATATDQDAWAGAKAGDGASDGAMRPIVLSPFQRSETYRFYSANGVEQLLRLNMESRRFELIGASASVSGTVSADEAEPGTFIFHSPRNSGNYNTARFRLVDGGVIGAFPVTAAYANTQQFEVAPFIGANTFITEGALIDGSYASLETNRAPTGAAGGGVISTRISASGTSMTTCMSSAPATIESCPSGLTRTYGLRRAGDAWHATSTANARDQFDFRIALVNGERVYLSAGTFRDLMDIGGSERVGLRIGLPASSNDWPLSFGTGTTAWGSWGTFSLDGIRLRANLIDPSGQVAAPAATVLESGYDASILPNVRRLSFATGGSVGYAAQNKTLFLAWGAPAGLQPSLTVAQVSGSRPDSRTGTYLAFGLDGERYSLELDLASRTFSLKSLSGAAIGRGTAAPGSSLASYDLRDTSTGTASRLTTVIVSNDAVIGVLPLVNASDGTVRPLSFVGARTFVTQQQTLAALPAMYAYWFSMNPGAVNPPPVHQSIGAGGVTLSVCRWMFPEGASSVPCPTQGLQTSAVTPGATPGAWRAAAPIGEEFYIARIGSDLVYLSAANGIFKIALDISTSAPAWSAMTSWGPQVSSTAPLDPLFQQFACLGFNLSGFGDCTRFYPVPGFNSFVLQPLNSLEMPVRRGTSASPVGTYTFHQGRTLMVMQGRGTTFNELGIGMAP